MHNWKTSAFFEKFDDINKKIELTPEDEEFYENLPLHLANALVQDLDGDSLVKTANIIKAFYGK